MTTALAALFGTALLAGLRGGDDGVLSPSSEAAAGWIADLGSPSFAVREEAQRRLVEAGRGVIAPVAEAVAGEDLEVAYRAVHILTALAAHHDVRTGIEAVAALQRLAALDEQPAAPRAGRALEGVHLRAVAAIRQAGGNVDESEDPQGGRSVKVRLHRWKGDGGVLVHIKGLQNLEELVLSGGSVEDDDLAHLAGLTSLRMLYLGDTQFSDAALEHVAGLAGLHTLYLHRTWLGDGGLAHLAGLTGLRKLHLRGTRTTDAGLVHLADLTQLEELDLSETAVTDGGLEHLAGLAGLRTLNLRGTSVTEAGVERLARSLPECRVAR